jgi:DNA-binding IclR family transcriptional regulator
MAIQYVTVRELSERLKMDRSSTFRYIKRLGYVPEKRRTATSAFQTASVLTAAQADAICKARKTDGYL